MCLLETLKSDFTVFPFFFFSFRLAAIHFCCAFYVGRLRKLIPLLHSVAPAKSVSLMAEMQNVNAGGKNIHLTGLLFFYADLDSVLTERHFLDIHLYFPRISRQHGTLCLCICSAHRLHLWLGFWNKLSVCRPHPCSLIIFMILCLWWLFVWVPIFLSPIYGLGSEEGAAFPPIPWGVFAPGGVCLHGGHVALPLRLHHHLHSAPQVRRNYHLHLK